MKIFYKFTAKFVNLRYPYYMYFSITSGIRLPTKKLQSYMYFISVSNIYSWRKTRLPYQKSQGQINPPTVLAPRPLTQKLPIQHTYPLRRNPNTKNPRRNLARPPTRLPAQHFLRTSLTLGSLRRFMATEKRSSMRAVQRVKVKERGRLTVAAVVAVGYKQPHLGCHQVSSNYVYVYA